ncbi:uncharacterized protein LY89DRAFT_586216 [Mollisia scopiformis]|uniref:Zn(2)-C6 fungal-type domain-containing protein n=1 Tax=Mollisia scopiformis TaxID=149040 RepID=A0A194X820_MOLSC|nr:uncharacterized protein LY89DRAFT_586216 [Mollisia scopiformis]KUJ16311.1 hypothetical protein LY89DRAFT_586216 [Mollisia scopiformis]
MKLGSACLQCRQGKRKCEKLEPGTSCQQCLHRQLRCSSSRRISNVPAKLAPQNQISTRDEGDSLPPKETISEIIELYICYIHDKPHTLFHEPSLKASAKNGTLSPAVLFGILGLSARFSSKENIRSQGHVWAAEAKSLCQQGLENINIESIQACVLCGNICLAESNADSESLYFVIANRMAQLLKLTKDNTDDDLITREVKRRGWWSLYLIDRWASAGLGLPRQFHDGGAVPRLPMDEVDFSDLRVGEMVEDLDSWRPGIWSHMTTLVKIFGHIQDLNQGLVERQHWGEEDIDSQVLNLADQLIAFERDLPPTLIFTSENLDLQIKRGVGRTFVALHLGYHHYATLLYYQYLDQSRPATPRTRMFAQRCKYHAKEYCDLIQISVRHGNAEALHNVVGHMTVVSSSVHLHTLLLGDDDELPMARQRLEYNFAYLVRLRTIWPSVDLMMKRLITFQDACLRTAQLGTHRFDKWMVRFLLQHALALDEKESSDNSPDLHLQSFPIEDQRLLERSRVTESIIRISDNIT